MQEEDIHNGIITKSAKLNNTYPYIYTPTHGKRVRERERSLREGERTTEISREERDREESERDVIERDFEW